MPSRDHWGIKWRRTRSPKLAVLLQSLLNLTLFTTKSILPKSSKNWKASFSRLFGKPRQQRTTNNEQQCAGNRRIPTGYLTSYLTTRIRKRPRLLKLLLHEPTPFPTGWERRETLEQATHQTAYLMKTDTLNVFLTKPTVMLTLFDETLNRPTEAGETNLRNLTVTPVTTTVTLNTLH